MILLTDEEIIRARFDNTGFDEQSQNRCVAKAQLRNVVKWMKERNEYDDASVKGGSHAILISNKEWQALLDEVKE